MEGVSVLLKAYHQQLRPKICEETPACLAQLIRKCWDALPSERYIYLHSKKKVFNKAHLQTNGRRVVAEAARYQP